jgi:hypothetical protein
VSGPRPFDPTSVTHWINVAHNAGRVSKGSPDYADAQQAVQFALQRIHALNVAATVGDAERDFQDQPSAGAALAGEALHTAGAGTGELFAGVGSLAQGRGFPAGAEEYRQGVNRLEETSPTAANMGFAAGLVGPGMLEGAAERLGVGAAARAVPSAVPLTGRALARTAGKALAQHAGAGAALGGLSGVSSGGADAGDLKARLSEGAHRAVIGALIGSLGAVPSVLGAMGRSRSNVAASDAAGARALNREALTKTRLQNTRLRQQIADQGPPPMPQGADTPASDLALAGRDFRAGRLSREDLQTAIATAKQQTAQTPTATPLPVESDVAASAPTVVPPASKLRGGAATPGYAGSARGVDVTGTGPAPAKPSTEPTLADLTGVRAMGDVAAQIAKARATSFKELERLVQAGVPKDQIEVAYYPRGGKLQQSVPPLPLTTARQPALGAFDPQAIAQQLQTELALAQTLGQEVTAPMLTQRLGRYTAAEQRRVMEALATPTAGASAARGSL